MWSWRVRVWCAALLVAALATLARANYKTAPMNGIMFGKRAPNAPSLGGAVGAVGAEYDQRSKAYSLCELATEACQAWFPPPDN